MTYPILVIKNIRRWTKGHPWIYSNEVHMTPEAKELTPGTLVHLQDERDRFLGIGYFNPHSLIAVRGLSRFEAIIDKQFFIDRLNEALMLREQAFTEPFYRLIHAEADQLPGLIIDRYNSVFVAQVNTAGIENLWPLIREALEEFFSPEVIYLQNDHMVRNLERLPLYNRFEKGDLTKALKGQEGPITFLASPTDGQKTGWFYDQRDNRGYISSFAKEKRVLDVYCYTGSFSMYCAKAGALSVEGIDRSAHALTLAKEACKLNQVQDICSFYEEEAFQALEKRAGQTYDLILLDPPAFVKNHKDLQAGLKGYIKLMRLALPLLEKGGYLSFTCCSHHVSDELLLEALQEGIFKSKRQGRVIKYLSAGADHPLHPCLPESKYLKGYFFKFD